MSERFWMVANTEQIAESRPDLGRAITWVLARRAPRFVHSSEAAAEAEAVRLATENKGEEFAVLEVKAAVQLIDGVPRWSDPT